MIIVDDAYVSVRMKEYMNETSARVLDSDMARSIAKSYPNIQLVDDARAAAAIRAGERVYAASESHFWWIDKYVSDTEVARLVALCKDKAAMRAALRPLYPDFTFEVLGLDGLLARDYEPAWGSCIVKPNVGFLSMGVYPVASAKDWAQMQEAVKNSAGVWGDSYDTSVITTENFIVESCITGTEYALDAYFDAEGDAHILNVLRHDFASAADTSDRLYYTGKRVFDEMYEPLLAFLSQMGALTGMRNFPVHVEVRAQSDGSVIPIEVNPLRFAGLGGTEITHFAYEFYTYDYYLSGKTPTPDEILADADDDALYCMSVIAPHAPLSGVASFDYEAFAQQFANVYAFDRFDYATSGIFGFMFWKTSARDDDERVKLLNAKVEDFVTYDAQ